MIEKGRGHLVQETLKSALSEEWNDGLCCFLHADSDTIIFG